MVYHGIARKWDCSTTFFRIVCHENLLAVKLWSLKSEAFSSPSTISYTEDTDFVVCWQLLCKTAWWLVATRANWESYPDLWWEFHGFYRVARPDNSILHPALGMDAPHQGLLAAADLEGWERYGFVCLDVQGDMGRHVVHDMWVRNGI